jgi:hypothetical protein
MFSSSVYVVLGDGASAKFWTDAWLSAGAISTTAPNLFREVRKQRHRKMVQEALDNRHWVQDITGARTTAVILEYVDLCEALENVQLSPHEPDCFV